ncbi:MAG: excinuclease ABC subunit A [Alphaproteobacteria bacterium]
MNRIVILLYIIYIKFILDSTIQKYIKIKGANEHNLKNIDLNIPKDKIIVFTGLSGSGKSSLAFDTIYAEGQRRYVESLSSYARQFLEMMEKPNVEQIDGLSPAISIEQKTTSKNPRSTVGTATEIYDYMRVLFARIGIPHSPKTGLPITSQSITEMIDRILKIENNTKYLILAPLVNNRKGEFLKEIQTIKKNGFQRVKIDGTIYLLNELPILNKNINHDIDIVIDRLIGGSADKSRIEDSLETALSISKDNIIIEFPEEEINRNEIKSLGYSKNHTHKRIVFSTKFACPVSGFTLTEIEPRLFSFNSPHGACKGCDGLGYIYSIDSLKIIPDEDLTINDGAILPWRSYSSPLYLETLKSLSIAYKFKLDTPWRGLSETVKDIILYGTGNEKIKFEYSNSAENLNDKKIILDKSFEGIINNLNKKIKLYRGKKSFNEFAKYQSLSPCKKCNGKRLNEESICVKIEGKDISQVTDLSINEALYWHTSIQKNMSVNNKIIAAPLLKEIIDRLNFLNEVGLEYLTLSRSSTTLSGGEAQRIRLASQIGSGLCGVLYVLDEPSIGLHQRDNSRLIGTLKKLKDLGNTVIIVEHDEDSIRSADYIVDIGIEAGVNGGYIVAQGNVNDIMKNRNSITGKYLSKKLKISVPLPRKIDRDNTIVIKGASGNNLKNLDITFPLNKFICVTGVSGSGKSTLINGTLYKALAKKINKSSDIPEKYTSIEGSEHIDKIIEINQSPIGRTPRSNPATYTGTFTPIRDWYASLPESKTRGYKSGRFSFNVKGGRCHKCEGDGVIKIEMHFLSDVYITCDSCKGKRYNRETLEIKYKEKNISDILNLSVSEGIDFFKAIPSIRDKLLMLDRVGLGYIKIGQQATTISGGEAQRIKLSKELAKRSTGKTIYILDEPTTGLHFHDVSKLLDILHELVDQGNTVITIEHNLEVIKTADWLIDLGPEGGEKGGELIGCGTPKELSCNKKSYTGLYLKDYL